MISVQDGVQLIKVEVNGEVNLVFTETLHSIDKSNYMGAGVGIVDCVSREPGAKLVSIRWLLPLDIANEHLCSSR